MDLDSLEQRLAGGDESSTGSVYVSEMEICARVIALTALEFCA